MKKIAVLTSGGDAPGMNPAIRSVLKTGLSKGMEVYGIYGGYKGLYEGNIKQLTHSDASGLIDLGGTMLKSARFPEFKEESIRQEAIKQLEQRGIEALVVIGGDGSYMGAYKLTQMGYPCIGLPGTIDNDIAGTDYTIGFMTALNTIVDSTEKVKNTSYSHNRCAVVEVMGRNCGDLALAAGIATSATSIVVPEAEKSFDQIIADIKKAQKYGKESFTIIVSEGVGNSEELARKIEEETGIESRATVLGHIQRGGRPSPFDRTLASRMGYYAVELLEEGFGGRAIGIKNNRLCHEDIITVVEDLKDEFDMELYEMANEIA